MSWGVKTTCFKAPGMSLGGSGVSIGGVRIVRDEPTNDAINFLTAPKKIHNRYHRNLKNHPNYTYISTEP